jgi:glutaconate CoA-transferase, subunit B
VAKVDFITSPGYLSGGDSRARAGLIGGSLGAVVTDLALLDFEPESRRMRLRAVQSGVTVDQVRAQTGFELLISEHVDKLAPPSAEEVAVYRELRDGRSEPVQPTPAQPTPAQPTPAQEVR